MTNDEGRYFFSVYFLFHLRFISSFFVFSPFFVHTFSSRIFRVYHRSVLLSSFFFLFFVPFAFSFFAIIFHFSWLLNYYSLHKVQV